MGSIATGLPADKKVDTANAGIHPRVQYFTDGESRIIGSDGVNKWEMGIDPPAAAPTFKAKIDGSLDALTIYYAATVYRDSIRGTIGNKSTTSAAMTTGTVVATEDGLQVDIPAESTIQARVDQVEMYRTVGGGTALFFNGRKAYSGTAITYDFTIADSALGAAISTDNGIPKARRYIINISNSVVLFGSETYSDGTVTTNGSTTITGSGTAWTKAMEGKRFNVTADGSIFYIVDNVASVTSLTTTVAYAAANGAGKAYTISDDPLRWEWSRISSAGVILQESFPTNSWDLIQGGESEKATGLGRIGESTLLLYTGKSTWYSNKASANIWNPALKLHDGVGLPKGAYDTVANDPLTGHAFWFASLLDVVRSDGTQIFNMSAPFIHNILNETHVDPRGYRNIRIDLSKISDMHAVFYPARNQYILFATIPGETYPRMCFVLNLDVNAYPAAPPGDPGPSPWNLWILAVNATTSYLKPDSDGIERVFIGDDLGYRYQLDSGTNDSVPSGATGGAITAITSTKLTNSAAAHYTTGDGLKGVRVRTYDLTTWELENDIVVASNDATSLTVAAWTVTPTVGDYYVVGGIELDRFTKNNAYGIPGKAKKRGNMYFTTKKALSARNLIIRTYVDGSVSADLPGGEEIDLSAGTTHEIQVGSRGKHLQTRFSNFQADEPAEIQDFTDEVSVKGKV